jgi:hypothetical protein
VLRQAVFVPVERSFEQSRRVAEFKNYDKNLAPMNSRAYTRHKIWSKLAPENAGQLRPHLGLWADARRPVDRRRAAEYSSRASTASIALAVNLSDRNG